MALPVDKELILEKHCPSMSLLYLDDLGRAFRKRILAAMEEYANAKVIEEIDSDHLVIIGRLKEELRDKTDQVQKLVEALEQIANNTGWQNWQAQEVAKSTLKQWNTGKEVAKSSNPEVVFYCGKCGMPANNYIKNAMYLCDECGKEAGNG